MIAYAHFTPHRVESPAKARGGLASSHIGIAFLAAVAVFTSAIGAPEAQPPKPPLSTVTAQEAKPVAPVSAAPEAESKSDFDARIEVVSIALTAVGTLVIAGYTFSLARSTKRLWDEAKASSATANATAEAAKANAEAAKANADAARDSVEALRAAERAYVFAEVEFENWGSSPQPTPFPTSRSEWMNAKVKFWNYGKTPAVIVMIRASLRIGGGIPTGHIEFPGSDSRLPPGLAVRPADRFEVDVQRQAEQTDDIENGNLMVYCVGKIEYADVLGGEHYTSFCWRYLGGRRKWELARESPLNERT
jgi:hypothetical protein